MSQWRVNFKPHLVGPALLNPQDLVHERSPTSLATPAPAAPSRAHRRRTCPDFARRREPGWEQGPGWELPASLLESGREVQGAAQLSPFKALCKTHPNNNPSSGLGAAVTGMLFCYLWPRPAGKVSTPVVKPQKTGPIRGGVDHSHQCGDRPKLLLIKLQARAANYPTGRGLRVNFLSLLVSDYGIPSISSSYPPQNELLWSSWHMPT